MIIAGEKNFSAGFRPGVNMQNQPANGFAGGASIF